MASSLIVFVRFLQAVSDWRNKAKSDPHRLHDELVQA